MPHVLTFDLGTTYFKVCLFDDAGQLLALRRAAPPVVRSPEGHCELPVEGLRRVLVGAVRELQADIGEVFSGVRAVCFATQANSFVLLDSSDNPLTPVIMWPDNRACPTEPLIGEMPQLDGFYRTTGIPEVSGQFMPAKLLWLRKNEPGVWSQLHRVCLISDYLTLWMTGRHVTEAGTAGLSGLVDIHHMRWWPDACQHLGISTSYLPSIARAGTDLGAIRAEVAMLFGLPKECRFIVGCLDQYAGAIGAGNVTPGGVSETTGTVLATVRCADRFDAEAPDGVFQGPGSHEHSWYQMVFGDTSANLLEAYRNSLPDKPVYELLCAAANDIPPGADGLRLNKNDLSGTDTMFIGLMRRHTGGHRVRAILEAVAYALDEQLRVLCGDYRPAYLRSVGGAARSDLWLQIKADVLGLPVHATQCPEPTSLGAAILAACTLRRAGPDEMVNAWVRTRKISRPSIETRRVYAERWG